MKIPVEVWIRHWSMVLEAVGSSPEQGTFYFFFNFMYLKLAVTFFSGFERSTNFHIFIYMPIRSYHININSGVGWSLFDFLLSKCCIFSP